MVDFSRAEGSKNHRASFTKTCTNVISFIDELQSSYNKTWETLEHTRKERAAIIEETIQLIKNAKIRLGKQLGRCDNKELNEELLNAINALEGEEKEKIQINLIKINNRYDKIQKLGKELENLTEKIANYRVLEDDYDDEVVITMPKKDVDKNQRKETSNLKKEEQKPIVNETEGLEKVINIHEAKAILLDDLEFKIGKKEIQEENNIDAEDIKYFTATDLYNTNELASIQDEVDYLTSVDESLTEEELDSPNKDECILFTINDKLTLKEIAKNVYQSEENWLPLYNYGNNTNKLDRKAAEYNVSVEELVSTPGYLTDVTLEFPTLLVKPEEMTETKKHSRRAA